MKNTALTFRTPDAPEHATCPEVLLLGPVPGPPENEKKCVDVSHLGRTRMCYVTSRSHEMQKHKFGVTCPNVLLFRPALGPPKKEK
jgi:hypothetical protein